MKLCRSEGTSYDFSKYHDFTRTCRLPMSLPDFTTIKQNSSWRQEVERIADRRTDLKRIAIKQDFLYHFRIRNADTELFFLVNIVRFVQDLRKYP